MSFPLSQLPPPAFQNWAFINSLSDQPDISMGIAAAPAPPANTIPQDRDRALAKGLQCRIQKNAQMEIECYEVASDLGNPTASVYLARFYQAGYFHIKKDIPTAIHYYKKAIKQGSIQYATHRVLPQLCGQLAQHYYELFQFDKAAEQYLDSIVTICDNTDLYICNSTSPQPYLKPYLPPFLHCLALLSPDQTLGFAHRLIQKNKSQKFLSDQEKYETIALIIVAHFKVNNHKLAASCLFENPKAAAKLPLTTFRQIFSTLINSIGSNEKFTFYSVEQFLCELASDKDLDFSARKMALLTLIQLDSDKAESSEGEDKIDLYLNIIHNCCYALSLKDIWDKREIRDLKNKITWTANTAFTWFKANNNSSTTIDPEEPFEYGKILAKKSEIECMPAALLFIEMAQKLGHPEAQTYLDQLHLRLQI